VPNVPVIGVTRPVTGLSGLVMLVARGTAGQVMADCGAMAGAVMRASVGDVLVVPGNGRRAGLVIGVIGKDGAPPYVIKWLSDGHIAMVTPDQYSRIIPAPGGPHHGQRSPGER
jgi:Domain of unknown function (DUF1918)